jgi:hypothetical protein
VKNQLLSLPPNVRLIITTRPDAVGGRVLPVLKRLSGGSLEVQPDVLRKSSGDSGAGGVMILRTVLKEVLKRDPQQQDGGKNNLAGLYTAYRQCFEVCFGLYDQRPRVGQVLQVIAAAQEPLAMSLLQQMQLSDDLKLLPGWGVLYYELEHHLYTLHKSQADWLAGSAAGPYRVDAALGHLRLGVHLAREVLREGGQPSIYAIKYVVKVRPGAISVGVRRWRL